MRILRTIRSVNPEGGGPIEGITQVSRILHTMGHEVELLSLDAPDDPWVHSCPFKVHAMGKGGRNYGYAPEYLAWLKPQHKSYDAIIVSGLWQFQTLGTWLAMRGSKVPYYVFPHGMLDPWFKRKYPLKHLKKWLYWPWAEYRVLRDARAVLFTCEEERRLARESFWLYRCREHVVNYGTAAPSGNPHEQREIFFRTFPHLHGKKILLFMGRLHPKKGCDILLQAFHGFLAQQSSSVPWHLVLAGPDQADWKKYLEEDVQFLGLENKVTFTGMLKGDPKWGALRAADLFVLPSYQENFGIAVVEALACGVPVLVSTSVNIWREIVDDRAGWSCKTEVLDITRALKVWADTSEGEQNQCRLRAAACFAARFEIRRVAESLLGAVQARDIRMPVTADLVTS